MISLVPHTDSNREPTDYKSVIAKAIGFDTAEDLLKDWENDHIKNWDANNLLAKIDTWQTSDISIGQFIIIILRVFLVFNLKKLGSLLDI